MLDTVVEIGACLIDSLLAMWFITSFNNEKIYKNYKFLLFLAIHFLFNVSVLFITSFSVAATIINLLIILLYSLLNKNSSIAKRIIAPFAFEGTLILINTFFIYVLGIITNNQAAEVVNSKGLTRILSLLICKIVFWIALSLILRLIKVNALKFKDYFLLILFPITAFFIFAIFLKISMMYNVSSLYGYLIFSVVLILISNIGVYYLVYKIERNNKYELEKDLYKQMITFEEKRYQDMKASSEQIKKIRHDIKNQLMSIELKIENNNENGAKKEIKEILDKVNSVGNTINSGNRIVDYIINTKLGTMNIDKHVFGDVSKITVMSDLDISIVLGNMIDNAIEAISGIDNPKIEILFFIKNNHQNIICKNSIKGSVLTKNPNLNTTKSNKEIHGYGLKSIKEIINKYNGFVQTFEKENMFNIHIVIPF